ncbi:hypothetical protein SUGI_0653390 [Cryptomeria japonica]|nr:hypothetical protein SUGI_0653390 [Cryptomeria japonica]
MLPEAGPAREDTSGDYLVQWLDKQRPSSVVFVAFGSESFLSAEQIRELALAVEDIGLPFLWSLRSSDGASPRCRYCPRVLKAGHENDFALPNLVRFKQGAFPGCLFQSPVIKM